MDEGPRQAGEGREQHRDPEQRRVDDRQVGVAPLGQEADAQAQRHDCADGEQRHGVERVARAQLGAQVFEEDGPARLRES